MRALDPQSLTRHLDRLYRAAWGLCGSKEDAEDLVQDTFARVLARPRKLRGDDELAYLMKVLRNTFLTSRRTASRRPQTGVQLEEGIAADERAGAQPEHALEVKELYAAVAELPEDFRLALVAVDIAGLSYREAADALGAREATITTRLFRARRQVVRALGGEAEATAGSVDARPRPSQPDTPPPTAAGDATRQENMSHAREGASAHERLAEQG
jgi:RNA polymerase sigma-70 factor, ECF subfamily